MKLQIASDLHLEFVQKRFPGHRVIEPAPGAQALILAGDIHSGVEAIHAFADWPVPVYYIPGNHESYGMDIDRLMPALREASAGTGVTVLNEDWDVITDRPGRHVRILGATLWTDYALMEPAGLSVDQAKEAAKMTLYDHRAIWRNGMTFSPDDAHELHRSARSWLAQMLDTGFAGPTVVVTHHGPHSGSIAERFRGDPVNPGFNSDLSEMLNGRAQLWVHGHVHDSFDYTVGGTRVVANPRGYALNLRQSRGLDDLSWENRAFDPSFVVEV